jgi:putative nucleotidyltransferase with HDIG domain
MARGREIREHVPGAPAVPDLHPAHILIADDDAIVRDIVARKLANQGYACECCGNEQTALSLVSSKRFDLVLTGFLKEGKGSSDLVREIIQTCPHTAVVLLTSVIDIGVAVNFLKDGAYDYITKPFSLEELSIRISRALEKRRLLLENESYQRTLEEQVASRTQQLNEALATLEHTYHSTLAALSKALDSRDADPDNYSLRVTALAARLAQHLGLSQTEIRVIEKGVLLHDIGKIGVPDEFLRKTGPLSEKEQLWMRRHPEIGYNILNSIKFLKGAAQLVLHHHERYDGKGYPQRLKGDEIDLGARIFAVADALANLTSSRPFRPPLSFEEAIRKIKEMAGAQLDPEIVSRFVNVPVSEWNAAYLEIAVNGKNADFLRRDAGSASRSQ